MRFHRWFSGLLAGLPVALIGSAAAADTIPRWDIQTMCAHTDKTDLCARTESVNRRAVFNRWESMPLDARATCLKANEADVRRSYKNLLNCLEDRALDALDQPPSGAGHS